jgi:hypothetical protein
MLLLRGSETTHLVEEGIALLEAARENGVHRTEPFTEAVVEAVNP